MKTRTGKIARLPFEVREEVARKLEDGMTSGQVLRWLNSLPEVQAVLRELFGGRPLNIQNLTDWRQGGHQEWRRERELRAAADRLAKEAAELGRIQGPLSVAAGVAPLLALLAAQSTEQVLNSTTDPARKMKHFRQGVLGLGALRRTEQQLERERLKKAWAEYKQHRWQREQARLRLRKGLSQIKVNEA